MGRNILLFLLLILCCSTWAMPGRTDVELEAPIDDSNGGERHERQLQKRLGPFLASKAPPAAAGGGRYPGSNRQRRPPPPPPPPQQPRRQLVSHPYMEKPRPPPPGSENRRRQQAPSSFNSLPPIKQQTSPAPTTTTKAPAVKRILALPIISSSYASTNYQGGTSRVTSNSAQVQFVYKQKQDDEDNEDEVEDKSSEQVIRFKPVSSTTASSTTEPATTTTDGLRSPYFPLITSSPEDVDDDQHLIKSHHLKHSEDLQKASVLHDLEQLEKGLKEHSNVFNVQVSSSFGGKSPSQRRRQPVSSLGPIKGSVEEVPLFADFAINNQNTKPESTSTTTTTTTSTTPSPFILTPGEDGVYSRDDVDDSLNIEVKEDEVIDKDQYVKFIASPPKQINIAIPPPNFEDTTTGSGGQVHHSNRHLPGLTAGLTPTLPAASDGLTAPTDRNIYQAGYQQVDSPDYNGSDRHSVDLREDPASYPPPPAPPGGSNPAARAGPRPGEDFYPLGKAPERNEEALPSILAGSGIAPPPTGNKPAAKPKPTKKPASSFLDFLIPSFLSGRTSQADPEGPPAPPPPPPPPPASKKVVIQSKGATSGPVPNPPPASSIPATIAKLPVPNRPVGTFPQPSELGGALNPIMIRVPGYGMNPSQHSFPKPPTLDDWNRHNQKILSNRSNRPGTVIEKRIIDNRPSNSKSPPPPPPPRSKVVKTPVTSDQLVGLGGGPNRVPPPRKQAPFRKGSRPIRPPTKPMRPSASDPLSVDNVVIRRKPGNYHGQQSPLLNPLSNNPRTKIKVSNDYVKPTTINQRQLLEEYLKKLNDPEYVQTLTKAHVYHDKELRSKSKQGSAQSSRQPLIGNERVTYIQDSNPFFFRQKARQPASPLPPKPPQLPPKISSRPRPPPQQKSSATHRPALDELAARAKPAKVRPDFKRPNAVYRPVQPIAPATLPTTTVTTTTTTTTTTTPSSTTTTTTMTTTLEAAAAPRTEDPIAGHIQELLKQYLATGGSEGGVSPSLLYDPEKNSVVLEYEEKANEPTTGNLDYSDFEDIDVNEAAAAKSEAEEIEALTREALTEIASEEQIKDILMNDEGFATYLTHLDESLAKQSDSFNSIEPDPVDEEKPSFVSQPAVPIPVLAVPAPAAAPSTLETLEQLFSPSNTPQDSDWFILNENGQRERPMTEEEVADVKKMILQEKIQEVKEAEINEEISSTPTSSSSSAEDTFSENAQLDYDDIIVSQRPVELSGGFLPIEGPIQPISDQLAS